MKILKTFDQHIKNENIFSDFFGKKPKVDREKHKIDNNNKISDIVSKIDEKNIKLPEYLNIKKIIIENLFKTANVDERWYMNNKTMIKTNSDEIITLSGFYVNNYGDSSVTEGVYSYYITCPGYNNTEDMEKLEPVLLKDVTSQFDFLSENENIMIITRNEFNELHENIKSWYDDKETEYKSIRNHHLKNGL